MPSSPPKGCSPHSQPMRRPANPLRGKTTDRRAVCGKSARTVRRGEGPGKQLALPTPIKGCRMAGAARVWLSANSYQLSAGGSRQSLEDSPSPRGAGGREEGGGRIHSRGRLCHMGRGRIHSRGRLCHMGRGRIHSRGRLCHMGRGERGPRTPEPATQGLALPPNHASRVTRFFRRRLV